MKKFRYFLEAVLLWIFLQIFRILGQDRASALGGWIGRTVGSRLAASRKANKNIALSFPEKSEEERRNIVRGMWENLGRVIAEYPHLESLMENIEIVGQEHLYNLPDHFVVTGGHLGNWELLPTVFNYRLNLPVTSIYREPNNPFTARLLDSCRNFGDKGFFTPKSTSGSRALVKTLQNEGRIAILFDQKYNQGLESLFFGRPAMTSPAFAQLARKYNCPVLPVWIERISGTTFRATIDAPIQVTDKTDAEIIDLAHERLEDVIRKNPSQWLWLHRRWIT